MQQQPDVMGPVGDVVTDFDGRQCQFCEWSRHGFGATYLAQAIVASRFLRASLVRAVHAAIWAFAWWLAFRRCISPAVSMALPSGSRQNAVTQSARAGCAGEKHALLTLLYIWSGHDR